MANYSMSNTKEELIKMLDEQKLLSQAVDAKDAELVLQDKKHKEKLAKIEQERADEVKRIKEDFEKKIVSLSYEVQDLRGKVKQNEEFDKVIEQNKKLVAEVQRLGGFINLYTQTFKNFMKGIQGTLDNTIELEALVVEKLQKN